MAPALATPSAPRPLSLADSRVYAVDADGNYSMPPNVVGFTIAFDARIGAAPTLVSPRGGASASLPIEFSWSRLVNPQSSDYQLQIARDSGFTQMNSTSHS